MCEMRGDFIMSSKVTTIRGDIDMGYETKVILKAIVSIMKRAKDLDEAIRLVTDIANAEDVIIESDNPNEDSKENNMQ